MRQLAQRMNRHRLMVPLCMLLIVITACGQATSSRSPNTEPSVSLPVQSVSARAFRPAPDLLDLVSSDVAVLGVRVVGHDANRVQLAVNSALKPAKRAMEASSIAVVLGGPEELWAPTETGAEALVFLRYTDRWQLVSADLVWPVVGDSVYVRGLHLNGAPIEPVPNTKPPTIGQKVSLAAAVDTLLRAAACVNNQCDCDFATTNDNAMERKLRTELAHCQ